ncbi:hypothetical protein [Paenibacillus anseongense]|uniref:hypothetical protein n=1 Tax=Paenibacillus anseongense TaxID=2682845 RepID=UPI002DBD93E3|nr:hypothetical protein [Paenibacillus anseongense]MEC0269690.1 hypothetical protein [Paenibacillus anseongense]
MPSRQEWVNALLSEYTVKVISSDSLIAEVRCKQSQRVTDLKAKNKPIPHMKTSLTPVSQFNPEVDIKLTTFSLLHMVGLITTPIITNLVDISSTWALYRYIWAFEVPTAAATDPVLKLSSEARNIDFHQKTLLSDEIGVGMAAYLMATFFNASNFADIEVALRSPTLGIVQTGSTSPDYLFYDDLNDRYYIVECKGSQTSRSTSIDQLRRGTEQVPSIEFNDGRTATSIVMATCMLDDKTEVYVIDPPGDKDENYYKEEPGGKTEQIGQNTWKVKDQNKFDTELTSIYRSKILAFCGREYEASKLLPEDLKAKINISKRPEDYYDHHETNFGTYEGVTQTLPILENVNIEVFRGLRKDLMNYYIQNNDEAVPAKIELMKDVRGSKSFKSGHISKIEYENYTIIENIQADGTMVRIKISDK